MDFSQCLRVIDMLEDMAADDGCERTIGDFNRFNVENPIRAGLNIRRYITFAMLAQVCLNGRLGSKMQNRAAWRTIAFP